MKNKRLEKIVIGAKAVFIVLALLFMFGGTIFEGKSEIRKTDSIFTKNLLKLMKQRTKPITVTTASN